MNEIHDSTTRISTLVGAAKQYSQLDRAPFQTVDVHELLDSTLTMLSGKIGADHGRQGLRPERCRRSPPTPAELNQVWTNLIDNAVDAMDGAGHADRPHLARTDECLIVEICDTGPGIPPDIQCRIFEPFFTTKPVGEGTGLGPGHLLADRGEQAPRRPDGDVGARGHPVPGAAAAGRPRSDRRDGRRHLGRRSCRRRFVTDVVVAGAGIVGLATAYELTRRGHSGHRAGQGEPGRARTRPGTTPASSTPGCTTRRAASRPRSAPAAPRRCGTSRPSTASPSRSAASWWSPPPSGRCPALLRLLDRGRSNGVPVRLISPDQAREYEPHVACVAALRVESTGIVDYRGVCDALARLIGEQRRTDPAGHRDRRRSTHLSTP